MTDMNTLLRYVKTIEASNFIDSLPANIPQHGPHVQLVRC